MHMPHPCGFKQTSLPADHRRLPSSSPDQRTHFAVGVCFYERVGTAMEDFRDEGGIENADFFGVSAKGKRR